MSKLWAPQWHSLAGADPREFLFMETEPMALGDIPSFFFFCFYSGEVLRRFLQCCGTWNKLREPSGCYRSSKRDLRLCLSFTWICFAHIKYSIWRLFWEEKRISLRLGFRVGFGGQNTHPYYHVQTELWVPGASVNLAWNQKMENENSEPESLLFNSNFNSLEDGSFLWNDAVHSA